MITFYAYGSEVIAIESCAPGDGDMRVGVGPTQVEAIDSLEGIALAGHLDVIRGIQHLLTHGLADHTTNAHELDEINPETKADVTKWENAASFVSTFPNGERDGACDVTVQIGRSGGGWYLRSTDDAGGADVCDDTSYDSKGEALEAATEVAENNEEGNAGENAKEYLTRQLREAAGTPCDDGEYCVYWSSACAEDCHVSARYETAEQAAAMAELSNQQLTAKNPGASLLCRYEVRQMVSVDGHMTWAAVDE